MTMYLQEKELAREIGESPDQQDWESNLRSEEVLDRPVGRAGDGVVGEDFPAVEDDDDDEEDQRSVGREGLESRVEGSVCACDTLGVAGFAETQKCD